jgi:dolichol-phosphate mannosyltransferase
MSRLTDLVREHWKRFSRFIMVGGLCTVVVFGGTYVITEYAGAFYLLSMAIMVGSVEVIKFAVCLKWVFGEDKCE